MVKHNWQQHEITTKQKRVSPYADNINIFFEKYRSNIDL